ncbi:acetylajmalan esterase-like [Rhododendron vialii]|uniref:acetylajmalan esterase-like n=1 Tax=Rhododendron vialii TaxID=182163 RepID=UPI00265E3EC7|nr:acetylajmalan esterase-like [Rhododendron vialii]
MAAKNLVSTLALVNLAAYFFLLLQLLPSNAKSLITCHFDQIYQLGDSISDTGNLIREKPIGSATQFTRLPYGETYFKRATGRCSNGRLMIDFIANSSGLPFLSPYKKTDGDFAHGVNYAVAGATALPTEVLAEKHIPTMGTNSSLNVQLDWMSTHLNSICTPETDCLEKLKNSLFMVGEIGGNDYNYALLNGKGIDEVQSLVPEVVEAIIGTVRQVIGYGAARVVVPGNFPIGCFPIYLTTFQTNNSNAYDVHHCLKELNSFSKYHNDQLQEAIQQLKREYPNVVIVYGDYYRAFQWIFQNAPFLGFDFYSTQKACCGAGGDYNFSFTKMCGDPEIPVCQDPSKHLSWDGVHLTEEAYKIMTGWLIHDVLPKLHCFF